jgi:hypothetical protein
VPQEWLRLKALVLDSVSSPITKPVYNLGLDEFIAWYTQENRPAGFTKATVMDWRAALEARGLGPISINVRITAVRKLAVEAADNGLLARELVVAPASTTAVERAGRAHKERSARPRHVRDAARLRIAPVRGCELDDEAKNAIDAWTSEASVVEDICSGPSTAAIRLAGSVLAKKLCSSCSRLTLSPRACRISHHMT